MKNSMLGKLPGLAIACSLALGSAAVQAQRLAPASERELWTDTTRQVWKNGYGECWHSAFGPPTASAECNAGPLAQHVAPVAAPAPSVAPVAPVIVATVPEQPAYEKVVLDANVLFDFDKALLTPTGRDTLDGFVGRIQGIGSGTIRAIGHADRFGTDDYNQALAERRVATVKAYLVSRGVEPTWTVRTSARGESQPTTKAGECAGDKSASTIACLQPDRHVFVELSGSRIKQ